MLDGLMGNLNAKQQEMQKKLKEIQVQADVGDGAVSVTCNADKEILNVTIDPSKVDLSDTEQLEDYLVIVLNDVLNKAKDKEKEASSSLLKDMLPPGMDNLFG